MFPEKRSNDTQKQSLEVFCKKGALKKLQYLQENTCPGVFLFDKDASLFNKETTVNQVFSCKFCGTFKNHLF